MNGQGHCQSISGTFLFLSLSLSLSSRMFLLEQQTIYLSVRQLVIYSCFSFSFPKACVASKRQLLLPIPRVRAPKLFYGRKKVTSCGQEKKRLKSFCSCSKLSTVPPSYFVFTYASQNGFCIGRIWRKKWLIYGLQLSITVGVLCHICTFC